MSKNFVVVDLKPKGLTVEDTKSRNFLVGDTKSSNTTPKIETLDKLYTVVLGAGMYMGIPLLTYPEAITIQSPFSP